MLQVVREPWWAEYRASVAHEEVLRRLIVWSLPQLASFTRGATTSTGGVGLVSLFVQRMFKHLAPQWTANTSLDLFLTTALDKRLIETAVSWPWCLCAHDLRRPFVLEPIVPSTEEALEALLAQWSPLVRYLVLAVFICSTNDISQDEFVFSTEVSRGRRVKRRLSTKATAETGDREEGEEGLSKEAFHDISRQTIRQYHKTLRPFSLERLATVYKEVLRNAATVTTSSSSSAASSHQCVLFTAPYLQRSAVDSGSIPLVEATHTVHRTIKQELGNTSLFAMVRMRARKLISMHYNDVD